MAGRDTNSGNRVLERVAATLVAVETGPATASEVDGRTELSVSTVHRLTVAMADLEFLRRDPDGRFRRGARFVRSALENAAAPVLAELRDLTGESIQLWVRRGEERLCIASAESSHQLRVMLPMGVGTRMLLPLGSARHLLAGDDEAWEQIAEHGWFESIGGRTPGVGSVSAPVHLGRELIGAVCLVLPLARVEKTPGQDFGAQTVRAADRLSHALEAVRPA